MSWLKIDDGFPENPKVDELSDRAFRLHVTALAYCARNLTDGHISQKTLKTLLARTRATRRHVAELEEAMLWLPVAGGGHMMNDYLEYNPSAEQVKADRKRARERMKKLRSSGERSGEQTANVQANVRAKFGRSFADPVLNPSLSQSQRLVAHATETNQANGRHDIPATIDFAARAAVAQARRQGTA